MTALASPIRFTREEAEAARAQAWNRYANFPHPDINVGWDKYLADIEAINSLHGHNQVVPRPSKRERKRLIELAVERDGRNCWLCAEPTTPFDRTLEHLDPISRGGTNDPENVVITHTGCNRRLGDLTRAEKIALRDEVTALSLSTPDEGGR